MVQMDLQNPQNLCGPEQKWRPHILKKVTHSEYHHIIEGAAWPFLTLETNGQYEKRAI